MLRADNASPTNPSWVAAENHSRRRHRRSDHQFHSRESRLRGHFVIDQLADERGKLKMSHERYYAQVMIHLGRKFPPRLEAKVGVPRIVWRK